ncbi:hypothetical protein AAMO2058_000924500 [Amorphochlora amoebiformis]
MWIFSALVLLVTWGGASAERLKKRVREEKEGVKEHKKANIIIVLTDDQDALLNSTVYQPHLMNKVAREGMTFTHAFANTPVCCPSRSSLLTGRYVHNHNAHNNTMEGNCASRSWSKSSELDTLATRIQALGYYTLYAGKYLNNYGLNNTGSEENPGIQYVPPGWSQWYALKGNSRYFNYTISNNGQPEYHGNSYDDDYLTDILTRRALDFLDDASERNQPFFMWIGTPAAHAPFTPAPQYEKTAKGEIAPRTPMWNEVCQSCHSTVRLVQPMNLTQIHQSDKIFRSRLGTLRSVDDLLSTMHAKLASLGQWDNTYVFYTSDHGFHLGQRGMGFDKRQLYETDIRVPLFVKGPHIPAGSSCHTPVSHVDLAPTILEIANGTVPDTWDGLSYKKNLFGKTQEGFRDYALIEYFGEGNIEDCGAGINAYSQNSTGHFFAERVGSEIPSRCDGMNNTYTCLRRFNASINDIFCTFECFLAPGGDPVACPLSQAEGYGEYYDMVTDTWQSKNLALEMDQETKDDLETLLGRLRSCQGQKECNL